MGLLPVRVVGPLLSPVGGRRARRIIGAPDALLGCIHDAGDLGKVLQHRAPILLRLRGVRPPPVDGAHLANKGQQGVQPVTDWNLYSRRRGSQHLVGGETRNHINTSSSRSASGGKTCAPRPSALPVRTAQPYRFIAGVQVGQQLLELRFGQTGERWQPRRVGTEAWNG